MCEKALRLLMSIPILLGSLAAYPQKRFPDHLVASNAYWSQVLDMSGQVNATDLKNNWKILNGCELSDASFDQLLKILNVTGYQLSQLSGKEKQFLQKRGHMAIYLSGLNPSSRGENDRAGAWMLTFPDAVRNGLIVNDHVDERLDFVKSTQAARLHFDKLRKIHGGNAENVFVLGAVKFQKARQEDVNLVEANLTALRLTLNAAERELIISERNQYVTQKFEQNISTAVLRNEFSDFDLANPALIGRQVPAGHEVNLPGMLDAANLAEKTTTYEARKVREQDSIMNLIRKNVPSPETHKVVTYSVKSGDVLGRIAQHYGVSVSNLKKWNELRSDRIDINQKLTIYISKNKKTPSSNLASIPPKPEVTLTKEETKNFTIYEVQPGDTLWAISKRFEGVKPEQIMEWNGIGEDLSIGQKLKIKTH